MGQSEGPNPRWNAAVTQVTHKPTRDDSSCCADVTIKRGPHLASFEVFLHSKMSTVSFPTTQAAFNRL